MLQPPGTALASQEMIEATRSFLAFFWYALLGALCIGLIAAAAAYLVRPLLNKGSQYWTLRRWAGRRLESARRNQSQLPEWLARGISASEPRLFLNDLPNRLRNNAFANALGALPEARLWSTALPDELFMHSMQIIARTAVGRPPGHPELFEILTADAPPDTRGAAHAYALLAMDEPSAAGRLADLDGPNTPEAAGIASTGNLIAASVERALDELQLGLLRTRLWTSRLFCVAAGVVLASVAVVTLRTPHPIVFYAIGVAGGIVALVIDDIVAWIFRRAAR